MIALLAALPQETAALLGRMEGAQAQAGSPRNRRFRGVALPASFPLRQGRLAGREVLLAQAGTGPAAGRAAAHLAESCPLEALLCFGFCGGLAPELRGGDLVLPRAVVAPGGGAKLPAAMLEEALAALAQAGVPFHLGDLLTAPEPLLTAAAKAGAGRAWGALAVDMESFWVASEAQQRGIPFLGLRAVVDTQRQALPAFASRATNGPAAFGPWPALLSLARRPWELGALPALALNQGRARRSLTRGLLALLPALGAAGG